MVDIHELTNEKFIMLYFFMNIMNFDVKIMPIEKVLFEILFEYNRNLCCISVRKLSSKLYCNNDILSDLTNDLNQIQQIIENEFINISESSIKNNEYILPNEINLFENYIIASVKRIEELNNTLDKRNKIDKIINDISSESYSLNLVRALYGDDNTDKYLKLSLQIQNHVNIIFSLIEHLFSLLYPLCFNVKEMNKPYSSFLSSDYYSKIKIVWYDIDADLLSKISKIRKHRNIITHGLFSKEKYIYVKIPGFGNYPLFIGERNRFDIKKKAIFTYNDYMYYKDLFKKFKEDFINRFPLQMKYLQRSLPVHLSFTNYVEIFDDEEKTDKLIDKMLYLSEKYENMDW